MSECHFIGSGPSLDPWCKTHNRSAICCVDAIKAQHNRLKAQIAAVREMAERCITKNPDGSWSDRCGSDDRVPPREILDRLDSVECVRCHATIAGPGGYALVDDDNQVVKFEGDVILVRVKAAE